MSKTFNIILIVVIVVFGAGFYIVQHSVKNSAVTPAPTSNATSTPVQTVFDGKNVIFTIEGTLVTLVNGISKVPAAPGSAAMVTTTYFGNKATGDLNGDGLPDTAFLVTQDRGGSGLFYYVVVALKTPTGYQTTNAFLIGDRIAPQTTEIHADSKELYVNFAERKKGEPMTTLPSQGATLYLKVTPDGVLEGLMK